MDARGKFGEHERSVRVARGAAFTAVKRKKQENFFKDKVFIFTVQSLILHKYSPDLLNFLELY
jgi:hypothetical protein